MNFINLELFLCEIVLDHKYKVLLQNVPTRHIITEITSPEQIIRLRKLDITNFFILGRLESIRNVLGKQVWIKIEIPFRHFVMVRI